MLDQNQWGYWIPASRCTWVKPLMRGISEKLCAHLASLFFLSAEMIEKILAADISCFQRQTPPRPVVSTWFSASIIQTDVHKILSRRDRQFASPECSPWNKQMRSDIPCDSPCIGVNRIRPRLLTPPLGFFLHQVALIPTTKDVTWKAPNQKDIKILNWRNICRIWKKGAEWQWVRRVNGYETHVRCTEHLGAAAARRTCTT